MDVESVLGGLSHDGGFGGGSGEGGVNREARRLSVKVVDASYVILVLTWQRRKEKRDEA